MDFKGKNRELVGTPLRRVEGIAKVTGQALYIDDMAFEGMLYGLTIRSEQPRAKIKDIQFAKDFPWGEFTIVGPKDIPGDNVVALILDDQPYLVDGQTNHPFEAILLLAHPDRHMLERARRKITIIYESLPAVLTVEEALAKKAVVWGKDNIFKSFCIEKGNIDAVWAKAAHIVEGTYQTGAQEQLYIEPQGMIAKASLEEGVTIWGSLQCPYYVHKALTRLFKLPPEAVRIIQTETGGGFGGKEEYPSMIAGHAALLAWKSGRPVKLIYDRREDMEATTKRHPSYTRHRTAVDKSGKLLGMDIDFTLDGGAYATLSAVVLSRGTIHAAGCYECPNVRVSSRVVCTNSPPHGAFRGFGAPQSIFALERHLEAVAKKLRLEPHELRQRNFLKTGATTATGQVIKDQIDLTALIDSAMKECSYLEKRQKFLTSNPRSHIKKGIGLASFMHGAGFTGSGEKKLASLVAVQATPTGNIQILASSTEIGQGTNTIFTQIACDALGIMPEMVEVVRPDTSLVPDSGPTVASRTCMVVGKLVESACIGLKGQLQGAGFLSASYQAKDFRAACQKFLAERGPLKVFSQYKQPPDVTWDDETYRGDAYATYAWAVYIAEVSVDTRTYHVEVDDFVAMQEIGKVVHPILAAGQIEGGVAQGIGFALYENVVWKNGGMANPNFTNYIMPTSADTPIIRVFFKESPSPHGPKGAKGIGELPLDGAAPAILNAIEHATGTSVKEIPCLPEILFRDMKLKHDGAHT